MVDRIGMGIRVEEAETDTRVVVVEMGEAVDIRETTRITTVRRGTDREVDEVGGVDTTAAVEGGITVVEEEEGMVVVVTEVGMTDGGRRGVGKR